MGIVSSITTRDTRDHRESTGDTDDPLPSIDSQLRLGCTVPSPDRERYLSLTPVVGVVVAASLLLGGGMIAVLFAPDLGPLPDLTTSSAPPTSAQPAPSLAQRESVPEANGQVKPTAPGISTLDSPVNGYALDYPSSWTLVDTGNGSTVEPGAEAEGDPTVLQIGGQNAFSIRTFDLAQPVAQPELADMRAVTDAILSTPGAKLTVLDVRATEVGGLPAVYYLYYFPSGKQRGLHAHYFVFDAARMHSLVFQVVPATQFPQHAAAFDAVVASFRKTS